MIFVGLSTCANLADYRLSQRSGVSVLNRSRDAASHPDKDRFLRLRHTAGAEVLAATPDKSLAEGKG